ncbi:hypothetical protein FOPG_20041 [Fusarium oxysporum f. sp. conglutinans race 2 54008]|uniref:Uncharacterized protein n=1 Tax=Fusarium oxysporum f. sp. conglutinans race 2 54008 TaxID=1089457 RepID=X0GV15_FUSOX|nr:hypothetical protein FOPG_20041 [Fusarium oxysporum f. sp. conglutinans race 2 54008]
MSTLFLHSPPAQDKDTTTLATVTSHFWHLTYILAHDRNPAFFIYLKPEAFPDCRLGSDLPNLAPQILRPARYSALPYRGIYRPITSSCILSTPAPFPIDPSNPLKTQSNAGSDMSMMLFVQPDCPSRFAYQDQHRIKGLNAETLARVFLPAPSWIPTPEYAQLGSDSDNHSSCIFFSLNLFHLQSTSRCIRMDRAMVLHERSYSPVRPDLGG